MHRRGGEGFTLLEVLVVAAVLGVGLAGLMTVLGDAARAEGEAARRLRARMLALGALETEGGLVVPAPFRLTVLRRDGWVEARVTWEEGEGGRGGLREVRLRRWRGHG